MALIVGGTDKLAPLTYDGSTLALSSDFNVGSGDLLVDVSEDDLYTVGMTDYSSTRRSPLPTLKSLDSASVEPS
jgi:hypothetical protein